MKGGSWKLIFGYKDRSGGITKDETNGVVNGRRKGKKRAEMMRTTLKIARTTARIIRKTMQCPKRVLRRAARSR